jgi:hypothetical protein
MTPIETINQALSHAEDAVRSYDYAAVVGWDGAYQFRSERLNEIAAAREFVRNMKEKK